MTSFDEYRKKLNSKYGSGTKSSSKEDEKKSNTSSSPAVSTSSFAGTSFDEYREKMNAKYRTDKIDAQGVDKWFKDAGIAMKGMDRYYQSNGGRYVADYGGTEGVRIDNLLNSSEDVYNYLLNHKDDFENFDEMDAMFSSYRSALRQYDMNNYYTKQHYSQFDDEESYNAYVQEYAKENERQQTYGGKTSDELWGIIGNMDAGSEKEWVTNYAYSVMTVDDYDKIIAQKEAEHEALVAEWETATYENGYSANDKEYREYVDKINAKEAEIDTLKRNRYFVEKEAQYGSLENNPDWAEQSTNVKDDPTAKFGVQIGGSWLGFGDLVYDYINDIDNTRDKQDNLGEGNNRGNVELYKYRFMSDTEIAQYNYIYNTEGKKAANEYLDYLQYSLNERYNQFAVYGTTDYFDKEYIEEHGDRLTKGTAALAEVPYVGSGVSVISNMMSGAGFIDVAGQRVVNRITEAITGEYTPVDYNSTAMLPTQHTMTIRGIKAQNLADTYGVIELDKDKYPWLSRVLNGKSLGDVYQLGMSMVDSATLAYSPLGKYSTVVLGGAAASQGILNAVANGATEDQAIALGAVNGVFEMLFEKYSIENLLNGGARNFIHAFFKQGFIEGSEEISTTFFNNIADILIMAEKSDYRRKIAAYIDAGLSEEDATKEALKDAAIGMAWDFIGGFLSGGVMGGGQHAAGNIGNVISIIPEARAAKNLYNTDLSALVDEALDIDPNNELAKKIRSRLEQNKRVSGFQIRNLVNQNEAAIYAQDVAAIQTAAENRLVELGERGNIENIAKAIAKQAAGQELTEYELDNIARSKYGQLVANELNPENIRSGDYSSAWTGTLDTNRINPTEYSRLVEASQITQESTTPTENKVVARVPEVAQEVTSDVAEDVTTPVKAAAPVEVVEETSEASEAEEESSLTIEDASKKYGAQAGAMLHTYVAGQDVAKYDAAYKIAYDMGKSGVALSYAMNSEATAYLSESQKELAYEAGKAASDTAAQAQDAKNKQAANGKTGRRKGVVKAEGVSLAEIRSTFNDTQKTAYKLLSSYAETTGVDIVLYKSEANENGDFEGAQGKFKWSEDTIYIDINAGLANIKSMNDLAKYAMLRTFAHEFTHFIEKWNPVKYNEFRKVVFDTLTERGEDVSKLVDEKMSQDSTGKMTYDMASREVVAEAMTDILPDANFVQELAENHKSIFQKLLEKLKEFVSDLKAYYNTIGHNRSREANALKEQVGDAVQYVENIVKMFDEIAIQAVETYQQTVAVEETTVEETTPAVEETAPVVEETTTTEVKEPVSITDELGFTITDNVEHGSLEISFEGKPSEQVRDVLKDNKFRWHRNKKVWYGYADRAAITEALRAAYETEEQPESQVSEEIAPEPVVEKAPEVVAEVDPNDPYERLSGVMSNLPRFFNNGYLFRVYKVGEFWQGHIEASTQKDGFEIVNARGLKYSSDLFSTRPEAVEDIIAVARNNKLLGPVSETTNNVEEVTNNGENVDNNGTVRQSVTDGQGAPQVLERVETGDVQGDAQGRNTLGDAVERGQETGRTGNRPDAERSQRGHGEGSSQSTDLRRDDGLSKEEKSARDYASKKGYELKINDLTAKKGMTQVDIYDKDNLPTFNPVMIDEASDWNKVKEAIDEREKSEQAKAEKLKETVSEQIEQKSTEKPKGRNFVIGESLDLPNGEKARYKANIEAIRLVKQLEAEGRYATEAEQAILSKYVGWGGLANAFDERKAEWSKEYNELKELLTEEEYNLARGSTLNAHYTDISVIKAMYDGLSKLGFNGGRMLEPSSGVGNFVGAMPVEMSAKVKSWTMVELDGITGLIAKYLYPNADVRIQGFEKANIPNNYMDVAISNVPFGNYPITDKAYPKKVTSAIHNYFFAKTLDKVRPGGIVMFITSSYTMNSKDNTVRRYIMQHADLLGAIRLPDTAFKGNAGTEVVTDILVLKKRAANTSYTGVEFLEAPYQYVDGFYGGANINKYFLDHPEMVLGTATMSGGMYRGNSLTYKAFTDRGSLADQIREAFTHIEGKMDYPATLSPEKTNFAVERASKKTKNNGLVSRDGKIYKNENGELIEQNVSEAVAKRITGLLEIRDAARELQNAQQQGLKDTEIKKARLKLNKLYDAFVKKYGYINAQANRNAINTDPDRFSIFALENWDSETKKATKADIFSKNTIAPNRTVTSANDVSEGLIVSVNQTGAVDVALIAKLTGKSESDVTRELIDSRQVFKNRDGELETAEVYLSGNVRAKLRDAEALVPIDSDYAKNVEALKAVIPEDVGYQDIFVNPGTPWIPANVYSDFAAYMLGARNTEWRTAVDITYNKDTGNFTVELKEAYLKYNASNTQKWGTSRRSFLDLFSAMLNSKSVVIKNKLDDGTTVVDKDATAAANEKIENITKEFQEWLWQDEARRTELATLYNETFNSVVTPTYNGDNLTVNGANAMKPLRPHQRNAVQRIISSGGNTLLAHKVGAGKTYEMAAAAMKLKQLGLVKKPMFAVPKPLVAQWGTEFMDFFPTARLLVAEASDFTAANRKIFANRIANGDYDAVIVSYEQFEKLPISDDFARDLYQEQIDSVVRAIEEAKAEKGGKSLSVKDLEKKRKSLQAKIDKLTDKAKDEDNIEFEQLGVDALFIDEAHNFKNLFYTSSMTNVSGLGNKDGSKRAFDLFTKVRYLQKLNGGRGIVFATATPVMNSMSEMYIMQRYLQPDLLDQLGISSFDAWAKQFGEVVNGVEIKPSGQGYRVKQSFSRFKNMSELQLLFRNFADVLTDIPGLKIPKMKGGQVQVVVCEPGQFQQDFMKELEKRADNVKNVDPSVDNMLKITSDGRKISYTQRMIDPTLPYEEGCKIYRCADNVIEIYNDSKSVKGTQLVFCDMATPKGKSKTAATETEEVETDMESARLYDDIKARLIKGGIPAKEIAFIHEADTDAKKKKLFADVNDGKVRVLIGSTGKMGVGMNAQKRVVAIHHLDAPWRPGDVEQRNGRAFRQGNINDEVWNFTYVTEGSFDARLWDILDRKQGFINQIMNGENVGREAEDTGEVTLSAAEVKALASGSPLIMEQVQLDTDIKKLESLHRAHISSVRNAKDRLTQDKGAIATFEKRIAAGKADLATRVDTFSEGKFSITIGKSTYTDKKDAGAALVAEATAKANTEGYTTIGKFAGFELRVVKTHEGIKGLISGKQGYSFNTYPNNPTYGINHLIAQVEGISESVQAWELGLEETRKDMAEQEKLIAQPFARQAELDQKRARYNEVMEILNPKEEQALDTMDEDTEQHQSRNYLEDDNYPTDGVHWGIEAGIMTNAEARKVWEAVASIGKQGYYYPKTINGEHIVSADNAMFFVKSDYRNPSISKIIRFNEDYEVNAGYAKELIINAEGHPTRHREALRIIEDIFGEGYVHEYDRAAYVTDARKNRRGEGADSGTLNTADAEQHQQRTETLTDREVLVYATEEVELSDLTEGERDALGIFQKRLSKLEELQNKRAEQGRLYKEQQFSAKVDRVEAAKTLERMKVLDGQIEKASSEVLSIEDKAVLKRVLQKARTIVEQQERIRGDEKLARWRDRRNNAAAIKKYRERVRKDVDELTNWILHPNNKDVVKHIPDVLKESVIPFLSSINFMSKQSLRGGNPTVADKAFLARLEGIQAALEDHIEVEGLYSGYNDLPPDFMKNLNTFIKTTKALVDNNSGEFVINQMTSDELRELSKVVRTLKKYITQVNKFHANAMFEHVFEAGDDSIASLKDMSDASSRTGNVSNFVFWQQIRPAYAFERFGEGGIAIYDGLRRGQATLAFNTKKIQEFAEKTYTAKEVEAWEKEIKEIELGTGTVRLPVSTIMSFYELSKRPQALGHILGMGVRVATYKNGKEKISDVGHRLSEYDVKTIINALTPRQKEVADNLQQFMAEQGGKWGNYVSVKRFGEELFGEKHYFPIHSDGRHLQATAEEHPSAASLYALLNMSFTKELTQEANNRIVLYSIFDVFANHMASMAQYNAFALPMLDALKWFNYQQKSDPDENGKRMMVASVREEMARVYGVPEESRPGSGRRGYAEIFVMNILKAFNGTEAQGSPFDTTGLATLRRYNMAQVAYNFRVVVQQPLAITRAALLMDYTSIVKGMKLSPKAIQKNITEMREHSGIAAWKALGFYDVNISRGLTEVIKHDNSVMDKIGDIGMKGAEFADTLTWAGIWSAAKEEVIRKQKLTPKDEGFYEAVTKLFEDVIYKTQVVDSVLTKNEFMRDKGFWARAVGSFMSEPTTTASMLVDAYDKYHADMQRGMNRAQAWKKNRRMIGRVATVYAVSAIILSAVQAAADALRDDDDYQTFLEKWLEAFKGNIVDELVPVNKLPILSDFYEVAKELIATWTGADIYGNAPQSVFMQWYDSLIKGSEILHDKVTGEETSYTYYGAIYKLFQAASGISGLPMAAVMREGVTVWNNIIGAMAPSLKVKTYDPGDKASIRYAYQDGFLTADEAIEQLISQGLVDTEDEITKLVNNWQSVIDTGIEYSKIKEEYLAGNITFDKAVSMRVRYGGYTQEKATEDVNKWKAEKDTGLPYDEKTDAFKTGKISAPELINILVDYGGYTEEEAAGTVVSYTREAYEEGYFDRNKAADIMMQYGGLTDAEAESKLRYIDFKKLYPDITVDESWLDQYYDEIESTGIAIDVYVGYRNQVKNIDGKDKKARRMAVIDSLPISDAQKDALYFAEGWAASKLYEAPWH